MVARTTPTMRRPVAEESSVRGGGGGGGGGSVHESHGWVAQLAMHLNCGLRLVTVVIHEMSLAMAVTSVEGHVPSEVALATCGDLCCLYFVCVTVPFQDL